MRIGNAAHEQIQLDVFGEMMDAMHQARIGKLAPSESRWELQQEFIAHLEKVWSNVDNGIWEVRGEKLHFTYSKAMAWVAFDRTIKSAERFGLDGPVEHWKKIRDEIHADVCRLGFDTGLNSFVRSYGSKQLDASLLLLPAIGFLPPEDPRIRGTVAAVERSLVTDGLVRRYNTDAADDGLPAGEGAFLACSFWLVDAYLMLGRRDDAVRLFERLLSLRNDVGLLSEEYDPYANRLIGNFPQAFSHLALVNSATNLAHSTKPCRTALGTQARPPPFRGRFDLLSLLTARGLAGKSAWLKPWSAAKQGRSESDHRSSDLSNSCRDACPRSSTSMASSAIPCSCAISATRCAIWSPKAASSTRRCMPGSTRAPATAKPSAPR